MTECLHLTFFSQFGSLQLFTIIIIYNIFQLIITISFVFYLIWVFSSFIFPFLPFIGESFLWYIYIYSPILRVIHSIHPKA